MLWIGWLVNAQAAAPDRDITPPSPAREFRGAWVATVKNIDWPSRPGLTADQQKAELTAMLDQAARLKLNAILLQVRPACDALYASRIEPWSPYLTGRMGKPPEPYYDPLEFAVTQAHRRGLELHAWFNPYRALVKSPDLEVAPTHVSRKRPELVRDYGKYLWLDPGDPAVQDYSISVVLDVVRRYDVDGVHFDDYFYPYPEKGSDGTEMDFPDEPTWKKYGLRSGLSRDDWRRQNVNGFIQRLYRSIKAAKPWVKFGISPFGIWRPGHPPQIKGFDQYAKLYADARKWLVEGWVDYFTPQLYWRIEPPEQSFPVLLKWWTEQNPKRRHLWPGMNTVGASGAGNRKWPNDEILEQIRITRRTAGVTGHVHWNIHTLLQNNALVAELQKDLYAAAALVPASPWLDSSAPRPPTLKVNARSNPPRATWSAPPGEPVSYWLLQTRHGSVWEQRTRPSTVRTEVFEAKLPDAIAVSAVDRVGNVGRPAIWTAQK
ncbi:MAG: family 10 glycosylhydrolase [Verrucomicrobiae bacterium]|nr:family 10 glycosylhydrolase [Verrucomicrobiae bacterium]